MRVVMMDATTSGEQRARLLLERVPSPIRLRDLINHRDRQVDDLDEELTLAEADVITFVRLVPLVGG
jgi:hypothetical protein